MISHWLWSRWLDEAGWPMSSLDPFISTSLAMVLETPAPYPAAAWVLGTWNQDFLSVQQTLYPLSHVPSLLVDTYMVRYRQPRQYGGGSSFYTKKWLDKDMGRRDVWGLVRGSKRLVCFEGRWQEQEEGSWHEVLEIKRATGGFNEGSGSNAIGSVFLNQCTGFLCVSRELSRAWSGHKVTAAGCIIQEGPQHLCCLPLGIRMSRAW